MIEVTEQEAKARLGALVRLVEKGEIVSITRNGVRVARLEPEPMNDPVLMSKY